MNPAPQGVEEAEALQRELATRVRIPAGPVPAPATVVGLDISYETGPTGSSPPLSSSTPGAGPGSRRRWSTAPPGSRRGDREPLVDDGDVLGCVLRTQDGVRPVYVSPGHLIGVDQAVEVVLGLCSAYRLPDPVRRADHISRQALRH